MVIELGLPVSESSTRISKFSAPTDSEHNQNRKWLPTGLNQVSFDWEPAVITTTMLNC